MKTWIARFAWMAAGIAALYGLSALASVASGGGLDPPAGPAVNLNTQSLQDIAPSWHRRLFATEGGDAFGCGTHRFECVLGGGSVLDRETGIVWQRTPPGCCVTWEAAESSCLNHEVPDVVFGSRTGWRLPTVQEMLSLVDASALNPALPAGHPFTTGTQDAWTATQSSTSPGEALVVSLSNGVVGSRVRGAGSTRAWCIRAPGGVEDGGAAVESAPPPWSQVLSATGGCTSPRFRCVLNDEAVLDRETGLVWQRTPDALTSNWYQAPCNLTPIGGKFGWRLPSLEELFSLLDTSADSLPDGHPFVGVTAPSDVYFTANSNVVVNAADSARTVDISIRLSLAYDKGTESHRSWCVRGGSGFDGGLGSAP